MSTKPLPALANKIEEQAFELQTYSEILKALGRNSDATKLDGAAELVLGVARAARTGKPVGTS